jgi:hypothetical protein
MLQSLAPAHGSQQLLRTSSPSKVIFAHKGWLGVLIPGSKPDKYARL